MRSGSLLSAYTQDAHCRGPVAGPHSSLAYVEARCLKSPGCEHSHRRHLLGPEALQIGGEEPRASSPEDGRTRRTFFEAARSAKAGLAKCTLTARREPTTCLQRSASLPSSFRGSARPMFTIAPGDPSRGPTRTTRTAGLLGGNREFFHGARPRTSLLTVPESNPAATSSFKKTAW